MQFSFELLLLLSVVWTQSSSGHEQYEVDNSSDNVVVATILSTEFTTTETSITTTTLQSLLGLDSIKNNDKQQQQQQQELESFHRQLQQQAINNNIIINNGGNNTTMTCASAFVSCQLSKSCNDCIQSQVDGDTLFGVSTTTKCDTILTSLQRKKLCTDISNDLDMSIFCSVFKSCTQSPTSPTQNQQPPEQSIDTDEIEIDCTILTECNWPGFKAHYIGDGVCNEYTSNSCYNTPICQYDGGDCCSDTCIDIANRTATVTNNNNNNNNNIDRTVSLYPCGIDGYYCRNVYASDCNNLLTNGKCKNSTSSSGNTGTSTSKSASNNKVTCTNGTAMYRVLMYDSFGDGWDSTNLTIRTKDNANSIVFNDQLQYGAYDVKYLCLNPLQPTCYDVTLIGGTWGKEISWEIRGMNAGSPTIAYGGSPMKCTFGTAGISTNTCPYTCLGMDDNDKQTSTSYKSLKSLQQCINDKCYLQSDACVADNVCKNCFEDPVPDSCYTSSSFIALSDCTICKCTKDNDNTDYCKNKLTPDEKIAIPQSMSGSSSSSSTTEDNTYIGCSANDKITSGNAVMMYTKCTNFTGDIILHQLFDNDNFGPLDNFEQCATDFKNNKDGTKTALGCTQILYNAMYPDPTYSNNNMISPAATTYHPEAIAELAKELFYNYERFCDCSKIAYSSTSAACDGYSNFKTLLKESIDACFAMDSIDCFAWTEFARPCQANIINKYKEIDFTSKSMNQCYYVQYESCGGVGKFPTFTRLLDDCANHVDATSWEFYKNYYNNCLVNQINTLPNEDSASALLPWEPKQAPTNNNNNNNVVPAPTSSSTTGTTKNIITNSPSFYIVPAPVKIPVVKKEYVSPDEKQSSGGSTYVSPDDSKTKSNWFRNFVLVCIFGFIGYHVYVRRHYLSSYQQLNTGTSIGNIALTILNTIIGVLGHIPIIGRYFGGGDGSGGGFMGNNSATTRSYGGNSYSFSNMSDPDEMYSGLSLESSLSNSMMMTSSTTGMFQPTTLPPGPTTFMGTNSNNNNTSGNYAI